jgi:hypothetical protein
MKQGEQENVTKSQSNQTFYYAKQRYFPFFALKLGHFKVQTIVSYSANTQA